MAGDCGCSICDCNCGGMDEVPVLGTLVALIRAGTSSMPISDGSLSESLTSSTRGFIVTARWSCPGESARRRIAPGPARPPLTSPFPVWLNYRDIFEAACTPGGMWGELNAGLGCAKGKRCRPASALRRFPCLCCTTARPTASRPELTTTTV
ncbi:hypothetical protein IG631_02774 [Alternaria alternata]|nr:hypothetical protein IG631_02774 [Alternaria alternata]